MIRRHDQAIKDNIDLDELQQIEDRIAEAQEAVSRAARDGWTLSQIWVRYS
jgi:hypothetical protein